MEDLKFIKNITWNEAFIFWGKEEAELSHWIEHYKKRGFNSWEEWRKSSVKDLNPEQLKWTLFEIENTRIISDFYAGPFRSWKKKYYGDKDIIQFKDLAKNEALQNDSNIDEIIQKFPQESTLIGLKKDEKIVIIEGMHRCCALSVAEQKGLRIEAKLFIIVAEYNQKLPTLGQVNSPT